MKQIIVDIPDNLYTSFINFIRDKFSGIRITEKESPENRVAEKENTYETMLLSEKSLARDWLLPEEDKAWEDL